MQRIDTNECYEVYQDRAQESNKIATSCRVPVVGRIKRGCEIHRARRRRASSSRADRPRGNALSTFFLGVQVPHANGVAFISPAHIRHSRSWGKAPSCRLILEAEFESRSGPLRDGGQIRMEASHSSHCCRFFCDERCLPHTIPLPRAHRWCKFSGSRCGPQVR